jgi:FkbM family methyltransferase
MKEKFISKLLSPWSAKSQIATPPMEPEQPVIDAPQEPEQSTSATIDYAYGEFFSISLPADHLLPVYQALHKKYDRFLPHLCKHLAPGDCVVDVGANCGDTLAAMFAANQTLRFVCVEADDEFFSLLQQNAQKMQDVHPGASIKLVKALVGKSVSSAILEGSGGTKHARLDDADGQGLPSVALDRILESEGEVRLLKSDVDGFDYDVIDSAQSAIAAHKPLLFFECDFRETAQKAHYESTLASLEKNGYGCWIVFDNFGAVILQTRDVRQVIQILNYVWSQNQQETTRTIYYCDLLACAKKDELLVATIMNGYP